MTRRKVRGLIPPQDPFEKAGFFSTIPQRSARFTPLGGRPGFPAEAVWAIKSTILLKSALIFLIRTIGGRTINEHDARSSQNIAVG